MESLRVQQRREKAKLSAFFENSSKKISFTRLCRKTQTDKESTGYALMEVVRDGRGEPCRLVYAPSWTFRAMPFSDPVNVDVLIKATDISYRVINEPVKFRRFVQVYEGKTTFFKEFGDPRTMSAETGEYYKGTKELQYREENSRVATEVLWFNLDSSESDVYGNVRWSGCVPGVIGSREQAEVNLLFFRNKAIPPMAILVSGGTLAKGARKQLEDIVENEIKGLENFHKILILEAVSGDSAGAAIGVSGSDKVKIELKPMTEAIFSDAIWQEYADGNKKELGQSFRLPPLVRGDTEKLNRATAKIARESAEQMVFGPERLDFEFDINRTLLRDMGVMLWVFKLNTPETTDSEFLADFVDKLSKGVLSINESRQICSKIFNVDLPPIDADWARVPVQFGLAGMDLEAPEGSEAVSDGDGDNEEKNPKKPTTQKSTTIRLKKDEFEALIA